MQITATRISSIATETTRRKPVVSDPSPSPKGYRALTMLEKSHSVDATVSTVSSVSRELSLRSEALLRSSLLALMLA